MEVDVCAVIHVPVLVRLGDEVDAPHITDEVTGKHTTHTLWCDVGKHMRNEQTQILTHLEGR